MQLQGEVLSLPSKSMSTSKGKSHHTQTGRPLSPTFKGTVSFDRFQKGGRKRKDLGLNKGRGWFLNFSEAPLILS